MVHLVGDVGGTNTRLALIDGSVDWQALQTCRNDDFDSLDDVITAYLDRHGEQPETAAFAVAGPVRDGEVTLTNRGWNISATRLCERFKFEHCAVVNDFSAVALGIPALAADDITRVHNGNVDQTRPIAILGPGTGLGVGAIVPCGDQARVLVTEGGHASVAAFDGRSSQVVERLRERFGHVSAERILSGQGMENLYRALCALDDEQPQLLDAAAIGAAAARGESAHAVEAMAYFFAFLGATAGDLALTYGAFGGVYIAGGIVPHYIQALRVSGFCRAFENKGRMNSYVQPIPVFVILHEEVELLGLAASLMARETGQPWPRV